MLFLVLFLENGQGPLSRSGTWEGHCVRRIEMSIEAEFTWSGTVLRSVYGEEWERTSSISSTTTTMWLCRIVFDLTREKSKGKIYVFVRRYKEYIYIVRLRWKSPNFGSGPKPFLTRQCQRERPPFVEEDPKIVRIHWKQIEINAAMHKLCKQETPSIILLFTSSWIGTGEILEILTKEQFFWSGTLLHLTLKSNFFCGLFLYCQYCMKVFHSWDKTLQEPFLTKHLKLLISVKDVFPSWNFPNTAPARSYLIFLKSDIVDEGVGVRWKERISLFSQNL